jgi:O-antigen/teichoic acid export membrane protein
MVASAAGVGSRIVGMACQLAMVPMMLNGLGKGHYGEWLTLQGILGFLVFADFGIGNGAMNRISHAYAKNDWDAIRCITSSSMAMLVGVGAAVLISVVGGWCFGHTPDQAGLIFAWYFAAVLPASFVERLVAAFQDGAVAGVARAGAAVVTLGATALAVFSKASFPIVCLATLVPTILVFVVTWWIAVIRHPKLALSWGAVSGRMMASLLQQGFWFFILQACATLVWATDSLLISSTLGADAVPAYAVPQRLFGVVLLFTSTIMAPLWPAYADAEAHGDTDWMNRMLVRSFVASFAAAAILSSLIALAMPVLLDIWVGSAVIASPTLAWGLAAVTTVYAGGTALSMYLNGRSQIRIQVALAMLQTVATLAAKSMFLRQHGVECLPWITAAVYVAIAVGPTWIYLRAAFTPRGGEELESCAEEAEGLG